MTQRIDTRDKIWGKQKTLKYKNKNMKERDGDMIPYTLRTHIVLLMIDYCLKKYNLMKFPDHNHKQVALWTENISLLYIKKWNSTQTFHLKKECGLNKMVKLITIEVLIKSKIKER